MSMAAYVTALVIYNFAWNFSLTFQYSAVNAVDGTGRGVAARPAFHGLGAAIGPGIAAAVQTITFAICADDQFSAYFMTSTLRSSSIIFVSALRTTSRFSSDDIRSSGANRSLFVISSSVEVSLQLLLLRRATSRSQF